MQKNWKQKYCNYISKRCSDLLEVPVGQLLFILYNKKDNYRTFEIKRKMEKVES